MSTSDLLVEKMNGYRNILKSMQEAHPELVSVLAQFRELFAAIENGDVKPPCEGCYRSPFHPDLYVYCAPGTPLSVAESDFICALEDWPSKPWYQALLRGPSRIRVGPDTHNR